MTAPSPHVTLLAVTAYDATYSTQKCSKYAVLILVPSCLTEQFSIASDWFMSGDEIRMQCQDRLTIRRHSKATFFKPFQPGTLDSACPHCYQFSKKLCRVLKPESTGTIFHISAHPSDVLVGARSSCRAGLPFNPALCGITTSLLQETEMLSGRLKPHLGGLPTVMSKWKWLFGNDSGCKSPIEMETRFSHLCQDRTKVPIC